MTSPTLLAYPRTPFPQRRPLQSTSSPGSSSPLRSSPLNPNYRLNNPPSQRRPSSSNQFHVQSRYIRPVNKTPIPVGGLIASGDEAPPQKAIWRQRFRQKCAERAERDRAKYLDAKRYRSGEGTSGAGYSQCSDPSDDMDMDECDAMDDSLYSVFMASERRRQDYAHKASFARAVGSSLDPGMDNFEEYERHFAEEPLPREPSPPPDIFSEADAPVEVEIQYPGAFDAVSDGGWSEPLDADMDMAFSSPPASPVKPHHDLAAEDQADSFVDSLLASPCPHCHAPFSLHLENETGEPGMMCAVCTNAFPLGESGSSWTAAHPTPSASHNPIAMVEIALSDGVLLICSDDGCQWGVSL